MIKKVTEEMRDELLTYVKKEPAINLFIIGDVEQFGFSEPFQEVFLQYDQLGISACILRYYRNGIVYSDREDFDIQEVMGYLESFNLSVLSGRKSVIQKLIPFIHRQMDIKEMFFCEMKQLNPISQIEDIHSATIEDLVRIEPLMKMVDFSTDHYLESNARRISQQAGRIYFIEKEGQVVASASTSIEASVSAMVGGVATHVAHRKLGYASQVVSKLCADLLNEHKRPCLFFHNPDAGKIYHRLGFQDIDHWTMINLD